MGQGNVSAFYASRKRHRDGRLRVSWVAPRLLVGWIVMLIAALVWPTLLGDPESIGSYIPGLIVALIPAPFIAIGIIDVGPRAFGRTVWLIATGRHEVFRRARR